VLNLARDVGLDELGGAEKLVFEFARRLDPARFKSYLCSTRAPEPARLEIAVRETRELRDAGVEVLALDRPSSRSLLPWARLYALLRRERIDIVHAHMPRAAIPGSLLARLAGVPVVVSHEHGSILYGHRLRRLLDRQVVGRCSDVVLAVSEWDRRNLVELGHLPASRLRVFRNGIQAPTGPVHELRGELSPSGRTLIGSVGRLDPVKGYDDLIQAASRLRGEGRPVLTAIAGVGPDRDRLSRLIGELGLGDAVQLLGFRTDVPDLLHAFDVVVMSSHSEGAPLALIEAMAAGKPIVATSAGGVPELIEDGVHGLLVPPRQPAALAAAVARLLDDPELAAALGRAARKRQRTELDLDVTIQRLQDLYLELYARRRGGS
jgi:glycosyltransferase involved in cell wall biosynthesis